MRILFVSNVSVWGGSVKSLHQTISLLVSHTAVKPVLFIPRGNAASYFTTITDIEYAISIPQFDNTAVGYYRGPRWVLIFRELIALLGMLPSLLRLKKNNPTFDIIHFNEIVCYTSCYSFFRLAYPNAQIITHVRSLQRNNSGVITDWVGSQLRKADKVFCIDKLVAQSLPVSLNGSMTILHNVSLTQNDGAERVHVTASSDPLRILFLGGAHAYKGADFIPEIASYLKLWSIPFVLQMVGVDEKSRFSLNDIIGVMLDNLGIRKYFTVQQIKRMLDQRGLSEVVRFMPFTSNVDQFFRDADVLIFPSRFNAAGRPSIEALSHGIPSVIFCDDKDNDVVVEGYTGYNVPSTDVELFARRLAELHHNRMLLHELSLNCIHYHNQTFSAHVHIDTLLKHYHQLN